MAKIGRSASLNALMSPRVDNRPGRLLRYLEFQRLFTSREVKEHDEKRMRRTGGTPQCRDTACRVRTDEECDAEIARISPAS